MCVWYFLLMSTSHVLCVAIQPDACTAGQLLTASKVLRMPDLQNICERMINACAGPSNACNSQDLQNHVSMTAIDWHLTI